MRCEDSLIFELSCSKVQFRLIRFVDAVEMIHLRKGRIEIHDKEVKEYREL